jgi:SAM-dependent methyltransferase
VSELDEPLSVLREAILDDEHLVRALATGRRRGVDPPPWRRVELRYVDLAAGRRLQVTAYDETQAHAANHEHPALVVDDLLAMSFSSWHVETTTAVYQLRVTKKGRALLHRSAPAQELPDRTHDRAKRRLLPEDHPVLVALGISDEQGRMKPSRRAKYHQVEELVRELDVAVTEARRSGALRTPTEDDPWRVVDLGCGNAYLTFAAHAWLREQVPVRTTGVDVKEQSRRHSIGVADRLGYGGEVDFVVAGISDVVVEREPDIVLALHACDTATDDALARAVEWGAGLVLAAPCCHHDISAQLRRADPEPGQEALLRDGILRERLADTLTDALRAALLRMRGYRVEVVEFVDSAHTPRNTLLRGVRTGGVGSPRSREEYDALVSAWHLRPHLAVLLDHRG